MRKVMPYLIISLVMTALMAVETGAAAPPAPDAPAVFYLVSGASQRNVLYESFLRPVY